MKYILTDVDGVLTDGRLTLDVNGVETKVICYRDLDAIGIGRKAGYEFAFVTGENTKMVDTLAKRFDVHMVLSGAKDKYASMCEISEKTGLPLSELVYIGDSNRDVPALTSVGLGIAPSDAAKCAKDAADVIAESAGGTGVLLEVVDKLISGEYKLPVLKSLKGSRV